MAYSSIFLSLSLIQEIGCIRAHDLTIGPTALFHIGQWNLLNVGNVVAKGFYFPFQTEELTSG